MPPKTWKQIREEVKKSDKEFEAIPAGEYDFVISKSELRETKQDKKPMHSIQCKVIHGEHKGRIVFNNITVSLESTKAMSYFMRQMAILGLDDDYFDTEPSQEALSAALVGRVFRGTVEVKPKYNDPTKNENGITNMATPSQEARQLALSIPTTANPNPAVDPSAGSAAPVATGVPSSAPAPAAPAPAAPAPAPAPAAPVPAPPVAPPPAPASTGAVPPPPPPPPTMPEF